MSWTAKPSGPWSAPVVVLKGSDIDSNLSPVILKNGSLVGLWRGGLNSTRPWSTIQRYVTDTGTGRSTGLVFILGLEYVDKSRGLHPGGGGFQVFDNVQQKWPLSLSRARSFSLAHTCARARAPSPLSRPYCPSHLLCTIINYGDVR